jgi:hypothetical protein
MEQIKTHLKTAFFIALVKLLLEASAILCTLYSSYTGAECCQFHGFISYRLFYLGSIILVAVIMALLSSADSPKLYYTDLSYLALLKQRIKRTIYFLNVFRLARSAWKTNDMESLADILMLHFLSCLAATLAFAFCEFREWKEFLTSFFLKPEILFPAASLLTLLRLILLTKNLCFSNKEEEPTEDDWLNT